MEDLQLLVVAGDTSIQQLLLNNNFQISVAGVLEEAWSMATNISYDAILVILPTIIPNALLNSQIEKYPPTIVISPTAQPDYVLQLLTLGIFGFLATPLDVNKLRELIKAAKALGSYTKLQVTSATPFWLEARIPAQTAHIPRISSFLEPIIDCLPERDCKRVLLAFRELMQNAIEHGSTFSANKIIYLRYLRSNSFIIFHIEDQGPGFDVDSLPHAAGGKRNVAMEIARYRKKCGMRPGGLGISYAMGVVDQLIYNEKGNAVVMIKYIDQAQ